ncbi:hypothetical protein GH722_06565 [Alphaproteobacteria bacterium HT1-32]|nr:hypothetical protein [Alphaproteobacteria bacterium HT1-32]
MTAGHNRPVNNGLSAGASRRRWLLITVILTGSGVALSAALVFSGIIGWSFGNGVLVLLPVVAAGLLSLLLNLFLDNRYLRQAFEFQQDTMEVLEEQKRFQIEAQQVVAERDRLSAIGTMAGGFAHNFNNLLLPILGLSQSVQDDLPETSPLREDMGVIISAARQAKSLVDAILSQARTPDKGEEETLAHALHSAAALARAALSSRLQLEIDEPADVAGTVIVPASSLEAALLNLIANARDAYGEKEGTITLRAVVRRLQGPRLVSGNLLSPGRYLDVSVADKAGGMAREVQAKALTPFFTTKSADVGTGLGLHTVMIFARDHGGSVEITSEEGIGTRVNVLLRITEDNRLATGDGPGA